MKRIIRGLSIKLAKQEANRLAMQTASVYSVHPSLKGRTYDVFIGMAEFGQGTATYTARPLALLAKAA